MKKVSDSTVGRLSVYLRLLEELQQEGVQALDLVGARERGLDGARRGRLAGTHGRGERDRRARVGRAHSITRGTRKYPPAKSGAASWSGATFGHSTSASWRRG